MEEKVWHKSYAPNVQRTIDYEELTVSRALTRSAERFPDHTALNYMGRRITYRELDGMVNRFAREWGVLRDKDPNLTGDDVREG